MSAVKYRIQQTDKQTRDRKVIGALFVNDRSKIAGALSIVADKPQGSSARPSKLVLDFDAYYYDVLPPLPPKQGQQRRQEEEEPGAGDDEL